MGRLTRVTSPEQASPSQPQYYRAHDACSLSNPWAAVALSATSYGLILRAIAPAQLSPLKLRATIRGLSATHLTISTILALCTLRYANWSSSKELHHETSHRNSKPASQSVPGKPSPATYLDDTHNQLITDRSALANTITFFETGYLIHDTSALLYSSYLQHNRDSILSASPTTPHLPPPPSRTYLLVHLHSNLYYCRA